MTEFEKTIQRTTAAITAFELMRAQIKEQKPDDAAGEYCEYLETVLTEAIEREEEKRAQAFATKLKEMAAERAGV